MGSVSYGDREKLAYLAELLPRCPGTGIIYTATRKCYEYILSLLRPMPQGLYDLMRAIGYTQSILGNIVIDLEEQGLI
jgi:superfamily II DNA helicase RecQ